MKRTGFYPGSFDPLTNGHLDIIRRSAPLVDRLVLGVGVHHGKKPLFSTEERLELLAEACAGLKKEGLDNLEVSTFDNLAVEAARDCGACMIIRGLRDSGDLDYEAQMAGMNMGMAPDIETVFLVSSPRVRHIAASLVRQIAAMQGNVRPFVPDYVAERLEQKFA